MGRNASDVPSVQRRNTVQRRNRDSFTADVGDAAQTRRDRKSCPHLCSTMSRHPRPRNEKPRLLPSIHVAILSPQLRGGLIASDVLSMLPLSQRAWVTHRHATAISRAGELPGAAVSGGTLGPHLMMGRWVGV
jgi:hypothetical protein